MKTLLCKTLFFIVFMTIPFSLMAESTSKESLTQKYDKAILKINSGVGYSKSTNENGELAWAESYILESLLLMYEATGSQKYLDLFEIHGNNIIANNDKALGKRDFKGRLRVGWGAKKYSRNNEYIVHAVHSGMLTYPLAHYAEIILKRDRRLNKIASEYIKVAEDAVLVFDNLFHLDDSGEGYYEYDPIDPVVNISGLNIPLPFNQQLALGRTMLSLSNVTGNPAYRKKATAMAKHFKNRLTVTKDSSYVWNYWYGNGMKISKSSEDVAHATIDVNFVVQCYQEKIVFTVDDMRKLANTLNKIMIKNQGVAESVYGTGKSDNRSNVDHLGMWLVLSEFNCNAWNNFDKFLLSGMTTDHPRTLIGIANLAKYYNSCNTLPNR